MPSGPGPGRPIEETPARVVKTSTCAARWFCVSANSVGQWLQMGAPRNTDGTIDLLALAKWYGARFEGRFAKANGAPGAGESTEEAERRKKVADADKAEMSRDRERGQLVDRNQRDADLLGVVESFVSSLENLPPKVVPLLTAARGHQEIDAILRDHIRTMRIQLAAKHSPKPADATTTTDEEA